MTKMTPQQLTACEIAEIPRSVLKWFVNHSIDSDKFDIVANYDSGLSQEENIEIIKEKLKESKLYLESATELKNQLDSQQLKAEKMITQAVRNNLFDGFEWGKMLKNPIKSIAVIGNGGSGKTALVYYILENTYKPVYVLKHPNKNILQQHGFNMLYSLEEFEHLKDCIVWIDEPQLHIPIYDHHANEVLQRMLSIARHNNITLILSTCETRFVTKGLEAYIDCWIIKDIEPSLVKQGSMIKKIIKDNVMIDINGFRLQPSEYLFHSRTYYTQNGRYSFVMPKYFDENHSKPYRVR